MFQEQYSEVVGFDSSWKNEKIVQDENIQTTEFSTSDKSVNTTRSSSIETQTDPVEVKEPDEIEMERLAKWLKKLYPKIVDELNDNTLGNAMASCDYLDMTSSIDISLLQEINTTAIDEFEEKEGLHISALSWNCTGNTIAVSCAVKHDVWCHHQDVEIHLYTFNKDDKLPEVPTKRLTCTSCVTTLAFHPTQPFLLSAGTVSGDIYLWNIQNDDTSPIAYNSHEDRVSLISWVTVSNPKSSMFLVSSSLDSHLIIWKITENGLNIHEKYKPQYYSHKLYKTTSDAIPKKTDRGIVYFDFSTYIPGLFVVGMEGGFVLKCSLMGAKQMAGNKSSSSSALDPYVSSFSGHEGEVITLSFSLHRKDLFLSYGTDDQIKIYHIEQESPVQIIFLDITLTCVKWIFCEPKLLTAVGQDGSIRLYSLLNGQPIKTDVTFGNEVLTTMAINHKRINMLAVGNDEGLLKLWSIPWNNIATQDNINVFNM